MYVPYWQWIWTIRKVGVDLDASQKVTMYGEFSPFFTAASVSSVRSFGIRFSFGNPYSQQSLKNVEVDFCIEGMVIHS